MSRPPELYQWHAQIAIHFPGLAKPVAMGLALWSLGMIVVGACSLSAVADWWSCRFGQPYHTVRERLRDVYREKEAKAGKRRRQLDVELCWAPGLGVGRGDRNPTGGRPGCHELGATVRGSGGQRALPGMCRAGGLEDPESGTETSVEAGVVGVAEAIPGCRARVVDRSGTHRPRLICHRRCKNDP
jgi:hypothetical protein